MKMDEQFQGIWICRDRADPRDHDVCQIFPDGRAVWIFPQKPPSLEYLGMTLRLSAEGAGRYRVKTETTAVGYLIEMRREGANLVVVSNHGIVSVWTRLAEREVPNHVGAVMSRAVWR